MDITSTGVVSPFEYWAPSCCCNLNICTKLQFDISQAQIFTFKIRIETDDANQFFETPTLTIEVSNDPVVYTISWPEITASSISIGIGSPDVFTFSPATCGCPYQVRYLFSLTNTGSTTSEITPVTFPIANSANDGGNQELTLDKSTLNVFNFYILAYLEGLDSINSYNP